MGDFIESDDGTAKEDVLAEQMTVWKEEGKANGASTYIPKLHNEAHQMWREFGGMFCEEQKHTSPGYSALEREVIQRARCSGESALHI